VFTPIGVQCVEHVSTEEQKQVNAGRREGKMVVSLKNIAKGTNISKTVTKLSPIIAMGAFIEQLTEKDRAGLWSQNIPMEKKLSETINIVAGRTLGISVIPGATSPPRTFKPHQFLTNKYIGFWIMGEIIGLIGESMTGFNGISKYTNMYRRITRTASIPGAIGAVFDDVVPRGGQSSNPAKTRSVPNDSYARQYEASFLEANR